MRWAPFAVPVTWGAVIWLLCVVHGGFVGTSTGVCGQQLSGVPINANITADIESFLPGSWIVRDTSSTIHPSKVGASVPIVELGFINTLPGGPHGYKVPGAALANPSYAYDWCLAAGVFAALMDANADNNTLPGHRLQLVLGNDRGDPATAIDLAGSMYSLARPSRVNVTEPLKLIIGSLTAGVSQSIASVARFYNVPFVAYWTDSLLMPTSEYPTLLSFAESYDVQSSAQAQFAYLQGWQRVATLSTLAVDILAQATHFATTCTNLNISVSSREVFDESQTDPVTNTNQSLDAAIARLKASDVRILYLSCQGGYASMILESLDRAGMMGPKYFYLGCGSGALYTDLGTRKPYIFASVAGVTPNSFIPDNATTLAAGKAHMGARYKANPDAMFQCNAGVGIGSLYATLGYQFASTMIQGLHRFHTTKSQCQLPENQLRLQQALPLAQVQALQAKGIQVDCAAAMMNSSWANQLGIDCCRLDVQRSPYTRPPDPFGPGAYVNGDGPVLIDALKSVRMQGLLGPVGTQTPSAPVANLAITNCANPAGKPGVVVKQIYRTTECNPTTNVCKWNITTVAAPTFGDSTTTPPDDGVIRYVATIHPSTIGRAIFVAAAVLGIVLISIVSALMWRNRQLKSIKSSSITFVMLILFAAAAALSNIITLYHDDQAASCKARIWMGHLSFAILFGSLLLKTFRLAHIFDNRALRATALSDLQLLRLLSMYVAVVCAVLISWMVRHAPTVVFKLQDDGRAGYYSCQSSSYTEMWVLLGLHAAGLAWGIYLCVKSQDVFAELNESKQIALSIYNVSLLSALIVAIDQGLNYFNVDMTFYVYASAILLGAVMTVSLLTVPKMLDIYRHYTKRGSSHGSVQRQHHTKANDSGPGSQLSGHILGNEKEGTPAQGAKRSSLGPGGRRASTDSTRVSDMGLGVTPTDWMKLNVFTRKCYEATSNNNIGRLMMEQNKVFTLLMQIYKDAKSATSPNAADQPPTTTETVTAGVTGTPTLPSHPGSGVRAGTGCLGFMRHRGSQSSEALPGGPFDVNEGGVRLQGGDSAAAQVGELFHMHQLRAQATGAMRTPAPAAAASDHAHVDPAPNKPDIDIQPAPHDTHALHSQARLMSPIESPSGPVSALSAGLALDSGSGAESELSRLNATHARSSISEFPRTLHQHEDTNRV